MFANREAFHPTARPKHKMHIRFFGPQTDGPPLDRRTLYPRSTASAYGNSDVRETRRTVRTKTSRLPRRSDQQRAARPPFCGESGRAENRPPAARTASGTPFILHGKEGFVNTPDRDFRSRMREKRRAVPILSVFCAICIGFPRAKEAKATHPGWGCDVLLLWSPLAGEARGRGRKSPLPSRFPKTGTTARAVHSSSGANSSFGTPQSGQVQSSGRSAKGTPSASSSYT